MEAFVISTIVVAVAEIGDKTQLLSVLRCGPTGAQPG
jgi:putative Ca2+/H+ antiporter (TMEM165/GDT1 family)